MKKIIAAAVTILFLSVASLASAHVSVKPAEVSVAQYQTFNVSVPVEKDVATVELRIVIPEGLSSVSPNVKPGWQIETVRDVNEEAFITEIVWKNGSIPKGFRDDFYFSAKAPATAQDLNWKAYQSYADGTVVTWELDPKVEPPKKADGTNDFSSKGPYSVTKVIDDLSAGNVAASAISQSPSEESSNADLALILATLALVASTITLIILIKRNLV